MKFFYGALLVLGTAIIAQAAGESKLPLKGSLKMADLSKRPMKKFKKIQNIMDYC